MKRFIKLSGRKRRSHSRIETMHRSADLWSAVSQTSSLRGLPNPRAWPIESRRYGGLEVCATRPAILTVLMLCALLIAPSPRTPAQTPPPIPVGAAENPAASTNAVPTGAASTNAPPSAASTNANPDLIQVSFQGANIDMIVQWLAQQTGKSVLKHPQVQCQLTITSSKKVTVREGIDLVYRALALEGCTAIESANAILIVKDGQEPKLSPELLSTTLTNVPEGRQRLVKIFPLAHAQAGDLRDRVRVVLSEKATVDVDERGNQLIVTDYNDNLRLLGELMKVLDVTASTDITLHVYPLKFAEAEDIGNLISMILNAQAPPPPSGRPSPRSGSRPSDSGPSMAMVVGGSPSDSGSSSSGSGGSQAPSLQVRIWSDKTANRLIVSAPRSKLAEVERLIGILDTNKPEDVSVRVIPLKHMSATDLMRQIGPLYQKMSGKSLKEMIELSADEQSNSLIVLSSETNFKNIERLILTLDTEEAQEKITRTFTLKNADAQDVAKQLQDLSQEQSVQSRYIYYFSSAPGGRNKKLTVVADRRRNAVIVQAPPAQMQAVESMIEELDAPVGDDSLAPRIFPLKFISAADMEDVLNALFLKRQQQRSYWEDYYDFYYGGSSSQSSAQGDVGRLYGKVRITSEPHANAIIVTANSRENLAVVEDIINQLDRPSEAGESTLRVVLKFAKASTVARTINILFARQGSPPIGGRQPQQQQQNVPQFQQQQQRTTSAQSGFDLEQEVREEGYYPWIGGQPDVQRGGDTRANRPVSDLVDRVRAVPDDRSNAVLISANMHFFPQILKLIAELDEPADQVLIEARLVEVSSDYLDKMGVRWAPDGSVWSAEDLDNAIIAKTSSEYRTGFGGKTVVNNEGTGAPASGTSPANLLATIRSGVVSSTISLDFLIQFLKKTTDATVLAEPQINIRDNETGRLFVGQQVPILVNNQNQGSIGQSQNFDYKNVGVILEVTPHINNNGDVELKIHAESSTTVPGVTVLGGAVFDTRTFRTDLRAKNGQTLVVGGIIQKQLSDTLRKTPVLGNIPGLGWVFKKKDKTTREVELMVFLRPKVVRTDLDAQELMLEIEKKTPLLKQWRSDAEANGNGDTKEKSK